MPWVILAMGLVAAPPKVQVISQGSAAPLARVAEELRSSLAADDRLAVTGEVLLPSARIQPQTLEGGRARVGAAREAYHRLEPDTALSQVALAREELRMRLDEPAAAPELAAALRVEGLTLLYLEKPERAAESFASAHFLDAEFSPDVGAWPPEARLAYADAIAAVRRTAPGSLSVRVKPEVARVWLDGREVGLGPTTVRQLAPGPHYLLATCPGYAPFAAVVRAEGNGRLDEASVFLESRPREEIATALSGAIAQPDEGVVVRQVAAVLAVDALVVVMDDASARRTVVWVFDATGARRRGAIPLDDNAAGEVAARLVEPQEVEAAAAAGPWYLRWYTLAAAGVVLVGGAVALGVAVSQDSNDRVSFFLGPPQ